jgi:hypothetical protein
MNRLCILASAIFRGELARLGIPNVPVTAGDKAETGR